ncbi:hypothetical protein HIM_00933 [Hirsutella minnesotensis 3608]|nr:hypothetical protein HIM_00933 [Hirsutella minnesotensis 3608]
MSTSAPGPKNILRGHKAQVHAATFIRDNARLVTGDAEGFVIVWDLGVMRPAAVWRAHENSILGLKAWAHDKLMTHGRDHKLIVWRLAEDDEHGLSTTLPVEPAAEERRRPWMLHLLEVNTLNFCSFAACARYGDEDVSGPEAPSDILVAVPNTLASESIDVFALPGQARLHTVKSGPKSGLVMSLRLLHHGGSLTLLAGFENGGTTVQRLDSSGAWITTYSSRAHSQPVLSLDVHPGLESFFSSSADSIIAQHPIPVRQQALTSHIKAQRDDPGSSSTKSKLSNALSTSSGAVGPRSNDVMEEWKHPLKSVNTKHSGQQSLSVRSDGRIFATAGWDSNIRVYSSKTLKELAVLQWHKVGSYAVTFANVAQPASGTPGNECRLNALPSSSGPESSTAKSLQSMPDEGNAVGAARMSVRETRIRQARTTHWIAAGSKDGKVSLWDIY